MLMIVVYAECRVFIGILSVIMLNAVMLSIVAPNIHHCFPSPIVKVKKLFSLSLKLRENKLACFSSSFYLTSILGLGPNVI